MLTKKNFNGVSREGKLNKMVIREGDWVSMKTNGFNKEWCDKKINGVARGMRGKVTMLGKIEKFKKLKKFVSVEIILVVFWRHLMYVLYSN